MIEKQEQPASKLTLIREVKILDFQGSLCTYHIDQRTGDVELGGDKETSIVYGMVSGELLDTFIEELIEIQKMMKEGR